MSNTFTYTLKRSCFDENYNPSENTRTTTNFANLARGEKRQENLRNTLVMINNRFNALASWDNPNADRYAVDLEIISVDLTIGAEKPFPAIEVLQTYIVDKKNNQRIPGIVGNNFSSYVRDYDFSVLLLEHNKNQPQFSVPEKFGELHGNIFRHFVNSPEYRENFNKGPVICLSVSSKDTYRRTGNQHPVLGIEYQPDGESLTELYFAKMGLKVRYFMPENSVAPFAFFFTGDLLTDYSDLELIATISTMETFQKIYRPEIYNANSAAGLYYRPDLNQQDHSLTKIVYDREERSRLAIEQGRFTEAYFIKPYQHILEQWSDNYTL
ncbi:MULTISPECIES: DUF1852 domain-containing protein [Enterobacter]|uniref:DUF1852 domain-containing protein n=1 Tax=Enterobacter rongchengensis TaxID=3030999 RepID=A0ABV4JF18_9ENTR|nr:MULTISPECIES: DUF1852 domain-containing protein [Enterobacter]PNL55337.1 DUF1852 domain-containing protein [Enterobacter hormaechei]HCR0838521.1 DUF1852 domain-containing protein [Enterobacter cancerogenus]EKX4010642.1 DUF1852 domain-containing protein [Enterobacter cloacae]ELV3042859.1 DUF1852 domain-containing protein [Enterobacter chengduensis]KJM01815.1 hypothetical protein SS50_13165 [Enterobacter chengduensis]